MLPLSTAIGELNYNPQHLNQAPDWNHHYADLVLTGFKVILPWGSQSLSLKRGLLLLILVFLIFLSAATINHFIGSSIQQFWSLGSYIHEVANQLLSRLGGLLNGAVNKLGVSTVLNCVTKETKIHCSQTLKFSLPCWQLLSNLP